jgi:hypothetical protein
MIRSFAGLVPGTKLERDLALQSVLYQVRSATSPHTAVSPPRPPAAANPSPHLETS